MHGITFLQALLLGVTQGLTEFLPISSSGHLVLLQQFLGLREPVLVFDIFVHIATLLVVFLIYRREIRTLVAAWLVPSVSVSSLSIHTDTERAAARRLGILLLIANIPTAIIGLGFASTFEKLFAAPWAVGIALLGTGGLLWSLKHMAAGHREVSQISFGHALLLGCMQGLAITPGISRSGSTIAIALLCGMPRELAARFSFLMAIPAILGAALLKSTALRALSTEQIGLIVTGMLSALVVGYIALRFLLHLVTQGALWRFAIYCWLVGAGAILISL